MLRDQPHQAGVAEQVRADLALLEVAQEYAVDAARQEPAGDGKRGLGFRRSRDGRAEGPSDDATSQQGAARVKINRSSGVSVH